MAITVIDTAIADVKIIEPVVFDDARGFFFESFNAEDFASVVGRTVHFVQDNHSQSGRHVLRGLHYQIQHPQAKLIRVIRGEIFDVAVDLRRSSATVGQWVGARLSAENRRQLWIPEGFAHGFVVLSESAECLYKTTDFWFPEYERCVMWNDASIGIDWGIGDTRPRLGPKDEAGRPWAMAEMFD